MEYGISKRKAVEIRKKVLNKSCLNTIYFFHSFREKTSKPIGYHTIKRPISVMAYGDSMDGGGIGAIKGVLTLTNLHRVSFE